MSEQTITAENIGTYYATENAQLPSIKCPKCEVATPLQKLVSEQECENCRMQITLKMTAEE